MTKKTKIVTTVEKNLLTLMPPPAPWAELAVLHTAYLFNDLGAVSTKVIENHIKCHPIIVVKSGRSYVVVGQYRSWRLYQIIAGVNPVEVKSDMVYKINAGPTDIPAISCTNLFLENLLGTLHSKSALQHLSIIKNNLPPDIAQAIFPKVRTDAQFATLLGFSRSSLYGSLKQKTKKNSNPIIKPDTK